MDGNYFHAEFKAEYVKLIFGETPSEPWYGIYGENERMSSFCYSKQGEGGECKIWNTWVFTSLFDSKSHLFATNAITKFLFPRRS